MSASAGSGSLSVAEHEYGSLLRLETVGNTALEMAAELLGMLESELQADVEDVGWKRGRGLQVAAPVLIQLESLHAELAAEGHDIVLSRTAGSQREFEELCDVIREHAGLS